MNSKFERTLEKMEKRLTLLENQQKKLAEMIENLKFDSLIIENLNTDKFELKLDTIDVKELSGVLTVGLNYGGKVIKMEQPQPKSEEKKEKKKKGQENSSSNEETKNKSSFSKKEHLDWKANKPDDLRINYKKPLKINMDYKGGEKHV